MLQLDKSPAAKYRVMHIQILRDRGVKSGSGET